jgi:NADPH:quinone reductase-like Zn-dependent oxidoreductase
VLDTLTGPTSARFLRTLKRGGMMSPVFLGFDGAEEAAARGITVSMTQVRSNGAQLAQLSRLLVDGTVKVAIDSTFPLADAGKAHAHAAHGHIQGKIVLTLA